MMAQLIYTGYFKTVQKSAGKIYGHEINRGATAAKNSGLNQIKGQWFTILDSDDEIEPYAIETMIRIPLSVDPAVTAITCNCRIQPLGNIREKDYCMISILM